MGAAVALVAIGNDDVEPDVPIVAWDVVYVMSGKVSNTFYIFN